MSSRMGLASFATQGRLSAYYRFWKNTIGLKGALASPNGGRCACTHHGDWFVMTEGFGCTFQGEQENPAFPPASDTVAATKLGFVAKLKTHRGLINIHKSKMSQKLLVARFMAQDPDVRAVFQEMVATLVREVGMNNEQQSRKLLCKSWTRSEIRNRGSFAGAQSHGLFAPRSKSKIRSPTDFAFGLLLSL